MDKCRFCKCGDNDEKMTMTLIDDVDDDDHDDFDNDDHYDYNDDWYLESGMNHERVRILSRKTKSSGWRGLVLRNYDDDDVDGDDVNDDVNGDVNDDNNDQDGEGSSCK